MKTALVLEGGAMRGMYTAGVLDAFLDRDIKFDGVIGVSAGALFGVNYLSKQRGRAIRYNKKYNGDKNYMGLRPLLKTGNIVDTEYAYHLVPEKLDPFDNDTFMASKVPFYAVMTDIKTGQARYSLIEDAFLQMDELRASGSMPFVSKPVDIHGNAYLDGAVADSIPYAYMLEHGYDRVVVVLTKDKGYVKKPMPAKLVNLRYRKKYPQFAQKLCDRHKMYNAQMERLMELKEQGVATVIQAANSVHLSKIESDPEKLDALYQVGVRDAESWIKSMEMRGLLQDYQ